METANASSNHEKRRCSTIATTILVVATIVLSINLVVCGLIYMTPGGKIIQIKKSGALASALAPASNQTDVFDEEEEESTDSFFYKGYHVPDQWKNQSERYVYECGKLLWPVDDDGLLLNRSERIDLIKEDLSGSEYEKRLAEIMEGAVMRWTCHEQSEGSYFREGLIQCC